MTSEQNLFKKLCREFIQSETSAMVHGRREAERLPGTPVADALTRIVAHADETLAELPAPFREPGIGIGLFAGRLFSAARQIVVDRLVDRERSFRGTLLGMHHGIDLIRLILPLASEQADHELEGWCMAWLETREHLVKVATAQLHWFAKHPREAIEPGRRPLAIHHD